MGSGFGKEVAVVRGRHFAVELGGCFHLLRAGVQGYSSAPVEESCLWHYFGGAVVRRAKKQGVAHSLSVVQVLGDKAQSALIKALEEAGGRPVHFLCWQDDVPPAEAEQRGNGFRGRCVMSLAGTETENGPERMRCTLSEVGERQHGNVRREEDGALSFSPIYGCGGML